MCPPVPGPPVTGRWFYQPSGRLRPRLLSALPGDPANDGLTPCSHTGPEEEPRAARQGGGSNENQDWALAPGSCVRAGGSAGNGAGSEGQLRAPPCRKPGSQPLCRVPLHPLPARDSHQPHLWRRHEVPRASIQSLLASGVKPACPLGLIFIYFQKRLFSSTSNLKKWNFAHYIY